MGATYLINFRPQFAEAVKNGSKRQTIRPPRADGKRMLPGDTVKLYTGLRTRHAQLLRQAVVQACMSIRMDFDLGDVVVDGTRLDRAQLRDFAVADGFTGWIDMRRFFADQYGGAEFEGFLVTWNAP